MIPYELSLLLAVFAFVYSVLLTEPGHLLNPLYKWLDINIFTRKGCESGRRRYWLFKIIIACERCVAGQIACWLYLYMNFHKYDPISHFLFISFTIFITALIKFLYDKLWT